MGQGEKKFGIKDKSPKCMHLGSCTSHTWFIFFGDLWEDKVSWAGKLQQGSGGSLKPGPGAASCVTLASGFTTLGLGVFFFFNPIVFLNCGKIYIKFTILVIKCTD